MAFYGDRVFSRAMNRNTKETPRLRAEVCGPLVGDVVEIGFGTGLNLPHLPTTVVRLRAVDPLTAGRKLAPIVWQRATCRSNSLGSTARRCRSKTSRRRRAGVLLAGFEHEPDRLLLQLSLDGVGVRPD
jgi:hypothetical protein